LEHAIDKANIDYLIVVQSPDYYLPATVCIVQNKAGFVYHCAAIDINQGCSGYITDSHWLKG
jgi:3-oxoacyl-[acyl-carrier-protein] synthase-3